MRVGFVWSLNLLAVAWLASAVGCGKAGAGKPVPLEGVLTWKDGTPIAGATVSFVPQTEAGRPAGGLTGKDGTFELTTTNSGDGAVPGEYKVVVTKSTGQTFDQPVAPGGGQDLVKAMKDAHARQKEKKVDAQSIPAVYTEAKTTPLKWTVQSGQKATLKLEKL
jgi:hypothetical protein